MSYYTWTIIDIHSIIWQTYIFYTIFVFPLYVWTSITSNNMTPLVCVVGHLIFSSFIFSWLAGFTCMLGWRSTQCWTEGVIIYVFTRCWIAVENPFWHAIIDGSAAKFMPFMACFRLQRCIILRLEWPGSCKTIACSIHCCCYCRRWYKE